MVFSHRVDENMTRIRTDGKQPTRVASLQAVMELASQGYSMERTAKVLGVSKTVLSENLEVEWKRSEYLEISQNARNGGRKGGVTERGAE